MISEVDSSSSLAVVILSCDKYFDVLEYSMQLFEINWNDCPLDVYVVTNQLQLNSKKYKSICVGEDINWATTLRKALSRLDYKYILLFLDDFFIYEKVETSRIIDLYNKARFLNLDYCRLIPNKFPRQDKILLESGDLILKEIPRFVPYRISLQVAIWRKEFLYKLAFDGFSPWQFEGVHSVITNFFNFKIAAPNISMLEYKHAIEKGKWFKQGIDILEKYKLEFPKGSRGYYYNENLSANLKVNDRSSQKYIPFHNIVVITIKYINVLFRMMTRNN